MTCDAKRYGHLTMNLIQALKEIESGNLAEAETLCRATLEASGPIAEAYILLGSIYLFQQKNIEAIACLETAYSLDETNFQTGQLLVQAYELAKKPLEAAELNKHRLRYFPSNAEIIRQVVNYYRQDGEFDKKIADIHAHVKNRESAFPVKTQRVLFGMSFAIYSPCMLHDFLLSQALTLRGATIIPLICGRAQEGECNVFGGIWGGMTGAQEHDRNRCLINCRTCLEADRKLWLEWTGIEPVAISAYITNDRREKARNLVSKLDLSNYRSIVHDGMPIGRWASDVIRNNHMVGDDSLVPNLPDQVRNFFLNILLLFEGCLQAIEDIRPDVIVSNDSYYYQWAILEELARRQKIPFYSHWQGGRRMGWCYAFNEPSMELNLTHHWTSFRDTVMTTVDERIVDEFLEARPSGDTMTLNTADPTKNSEYHAVEEIDYSKPTVLLAANVIWDLAALNREIQFDGMIDWVCRTIDFFSGHPDWQLIVKPHPGELNQSLPATRQLLAVEIGKRIPMLPSNVVICSPLTTLSVYDIIPHVKFGLVFTSTVGLEMACKGMAVVTGGTSVYHGKGFTIDPPTAQDYFETLCRLMNEPERIKPSMERAALARKFLYLYMFRYYASLNLFDHSFSDHPTLLIHDAQEIMPGANDVLDYICDSILAHTPVVSDKDLPPPGRTTRGSYTFTQQDTIAAARLVIEGYKENQEEQIVNQSDGRLSVRLEDAVYQIPKGIFKPGELEWIRQEIHQPSDINPHAYEHGSVLIRPGDVVVDAGACAGFFTWQALKKGAGKVYAFEPHPALVDALQDTFSQECASGSVVVEPLALTNYSGTAGFNDGDQHVCEARIAPEGHHTVMTATLDDYVRTRQTERIDFIKMDIEGEEMNAVSGALETINRFKPHLAIAVYHQYENATLIRDILLANCPGYSVEFGGRYMFEVPHRPYMVYAYFTETKANNATTAAPSLYPIARAANDREFHARKLVLEAPPVNYVIGLTNICQLNCPLCITGLRQQKKTPRFMEYELFTQIIEKIKNHAEVVQLYNWGESLLHPDFERILRYCQEYRLNTEISSNLSLEDIDRHLEAMVRYGLRRLIVSFDGVTQEDYSRYRRNGDLSRVLDNIAKLKELKEKYRSSYPAISLQFLRNKYTCDQLRILEEKYREWGADDFYVCDMTTIFKDRDLESARQWFDDEEIARRRYLDVDVSMHGKPCYFLYTTMIIEQDGSIPSCCFATDPRDDYAVWDNDKSILEMYNSPRFVQARRMFRDKCRDSSSTCDDCSVFTTCMEREGSQATIELPHVSIIIPSYNRAGMLGKTIESFIMQDYPRDRLEIIIADNNSTDDTKEVVSRWQGKSQVPLLYFLEQRQGVHFARNSAAKVAKGDILYFTDDDMIAESNTVSELVKVFSLDPKVGAATGRVLPLWECAPPDWILKLCYNGWLSIFDKLGEGVHISQDDFGVYSCHQAIRREALFKSGGFNPESTFTDYIGDGETGLNLKLKELGYKFGYTGKSVIHHMIPPARMTQDYLNKRLANQGSADSYTDYRKHRYSKEQLSQRIMEHVGKLMERSTAAVVRRTDGDIAWRMDKAYTHYYLSRIEYDIRLFHDPAWRHLVLRNDWFND